MFVHRIFAPIKEALPPKLADIIRAVFTASLTPFFFSYETGHFRSSLQRKPVNKLGEPIPWYTYPTVAFLENKDFHARHVLEFGAGQSTLWWAKRSQQVLSLEGDAEWYRYVRTIAPANVEVALVPVELTEVTMLLAGRRFDVVIVDGLDRVQASALAAEVVQPDGVIIVDNSDIYWGPEGTYPIMDLFRSASFSRVDFYGYTPTVMVPHCTSLFFKQNCFLFRGTENPVRRVKGGEAYGRKID